jgi:serine/threonine protein kinase
MLLCVSASSSRVQFPVFAIREITFLKRLRHPNIVRLLNIVSSKGCEELGLECLLSCDASIQYKWELSDSLLFVCVIADSDIKTETLKDDPGVLSRKGASNTFLVFEYVEVRVENPFIVWCSVTN